ncbi:hypothetical protein GCM10007973_01060 [Polymorphobacter multimanifer]|uniref:Npun_F0296 family exosortase-dependent surface protein n=1 Tax=Polymorphobacter multimanifer TaxID=1070431 RepID=UPI0019B02327|nr:PEP-CTERM sorting domain-containing protein [Polymorphobacter multimanifer]GGI67669.1 hypothetical protein GCM10007973_01060 [Polymorphobacter multimanifer]
MLKKLPLAIAVTGMALVSAAPASALGVLWKPGVLATGLMNTAIIEDFEGLDPGDPYGGGFAIYGDSAPGFAARPAFGSTGNFLAVQRDNTSSITIAVPQTQVLSFVIGSLDSYNKVVLNFLNGTSRELNGLEIITGLAADSGASGSGDQSSPDTNGRVFYDTLGLTSIVSFTLTSIGQNAFEVDNISVAAPEPGTWGMMILTAGIAGASLRRRRHRAALA